ncbi:reverse transcriptase domain-containing protein [Tanacetum coccineum]
MSPSSNKSQNPPNRNNPITRLVATGLLHLLHRHLLLLYLPRLSKAHTADRLLESGLLIFRKGLIRLLRTQLETQTMKITSSEQKTEGRIINVSSESHRFVRKSSVIIMFMLMDEPSVLCNLQYRYHHDVIYTMVRHVQLAINPFKNVLVYGSDVIMAYREKILDSPHVYALANAAYSDMMRDETTSQGNDWNGDITFWKIDEAKLGQVVAFLSGSDKSACYIAALRATIIYARLGTILFCIQIELINEEKLLAIEHGVLVLLSNAWVPATPEPENIQEEFDIEDFDENSEEIPMINLNMETFTQNLQTYMENNMAHAEEDVEPKQIILDPDDQPMWESAKIVALTPNSAIIQLDVDDNIIINSNHLNMIRENKFDGYLRADPHDHIREFLAICDMFRYSETQSEVVKLLIFPFSFLNEELEDMSEKYNELRIGNASKNNMNDDTPMCERHEANYIQSEDYQNQDSHNSFTHQSLHDLNDFEKSLKELNNDVRNDLEDFKRCIRSMRTVHWKLYDSDDRKTTGVLPNKKSKTVNQEPQAKTDLEKINC